MARERSAQCIDGAQQIATRIAQREAVYSRVGAPAHHARHAHQIICLVDAYDDPDGRRK